MPKRILPFALAVLALALAACGANPNFNTLYGTPQPTATASPTPDPTITSATVIVTVAGSPLPNQPVTLLNDVNGVPGTLIATQNTNATGETIFAGLTGAAPYCFSTTYTPTTPGLTQTRSYCGVYWQNQVPLSF